MDIVLLILGVMIIGLLLVIIFRKSENTAQAEYKILTERLIKVEGSVEKISPQIEGGFRENRKEIAENLRGIQASNEKKLEEMRETVDEKLRVSVEKRFSESFKSIRSEEHTSELQSQY